eukprot:CAMPEP_0174349030 /NCGR_PEP_ID=MMETSP0811_2-20130205/5678_1 /TAXON_ID=73025 ORGANISM="Eutreptiella gymnastica-like, Strain CCMP1594" /NCGR_SAMPLE_ID=MMETSP0811_2 /ASSEMBLY_ACC=CAM_ASM_000667 /LENGTH=57 /DNA_ID=CAMNT_0015476117 /DNA_START=1907 /DNA_END=2076 /DNA_ORIENTATION=+
MAIKDVPFTIMMVLWAVYQQCPVQAAPPSGTGLLFGPWGSLDTGGGGAADVQTAHHA